MCHVTATELKKNLSYYLTLSLTEDVLVTKNKRIISVLTSPAKNSWEKFIHFGDDLPTKIPNDKSCKELIGDAIWEHETADRH